jgi:hypothetical protein
MTPKASLEPRTESPLGWFQPADLRPKVRKEHCGKPPWLVVYGLLGGLHHGGSGRGIAGAEVAGVDRVCPARDLDT